jgi:hypothetical protein
MPEFIQKPTLEAISNNSTHPQRLAPLAELVAHVPILCNRRVKPKSSTLKPISNSNRHLQRLAPLAELVAHFVSGLGPPVMRKRSTKNMNAPHKEGVIRSILLCLLSW